MVGFKELLAWQKGYELALEIYKTTNHFPKEEKYGMISQIRRAAISVSANVAEGYEKQYKKEYVRFLYISKGSLGEVQTYLMLAKDLGYIQNEAFNKLFDLSKDVARLLRGLIKYLS